MKEISENWWDYISVLEQAEPEDTIKELVKQEFKTFLSYLDELYYVEANFIFLNLVNDISQANIAQEIMAGGISQMGVSKRVRRGLQSIKLFMERPEKDINKLRRDLEKIFPENLIEVVQLFYIHKTYAIVSELTGLSLSNIRVQILQALKLLEEKTSKTDLELKYLNYLNKLVKTYNVGDTFFKGKLNIKSG